MENLLIPYEAAPSIEATRVLVIAPHPDDEVFGCGGAILAHVEINIPVQVIIITDGGFGPADPKDQQAYVSQRQQECLKAAEILGYGKPIFWDYTDRMVVFCERLVTEILTAVDDYQADLVYAPSLYEVHPDHRAVAMATVEAVRRLGGPIRLAMYEVGAPLRPNVLLDITKYLERKHLAMHCFTSQIGVQAYDEHIEALNRYRTFTLPREVLAAEAFELVDSENISNHYLTLFTSEYQRQRELNLPINGTKDLPLVSILIRSLDQSTLGKALDSIAIQTYSNIEVIVVNAKVGVHSTIGHNCGGYNLRLINSDGPSINRATTTNAGLRAAVGQYLIILDDNDWLLPNHVAKLLKALMQEGPETLAIHTAVACFDKDGRPTGTVYDTVHDPVRLMATNYMPSPSVLFSRRLLDLGCMMDEALDHLEDWDFWLQVSCHTRIPFVPGVSACHRVNESSGLHGIDKMISPIYMAFYQKWQSLWPLPMLTEAMNRLNDYPALKAAKYQHEEQIAILNQAAEELNEQIANLNQAVEERDGKIANLNKTVEERDGQFAILSQDLTERDGRIVILSQVVAERDQQVTNLNQSIADRDERIDNLFQEAAERDQQVTNLNQSIADRDERIDNLYQIAAEHDQQIVNLNQDIAERDGRIVNLFQVAAERDQQITKLYQDIAERDGMIANLNQAVFERNGQISILSKERDSAIANLAALRRGYSWRLTAPFRMVARLLKGNHTVVANDLREFFSRLVILLPVGAQNALRKKLSNWNNFKNILFNSSANYTAISEIVAERCAFTKSAPSYDPLCPLPPQDLPSIDVSVVTYNSSRWIANFIESFLALDYPKARLSICFVDNSSTDSTLIELQTAKPRLELAGCTVKIMQRPNHGFGTSHNAAINEGMAPFCLVTNVDLVFEHNALTRIVSTAVADDSRVAAWEFRQKPYEHPKFYDPVTGITNWNSHACVLIRRSAIEKVGGYDESLFIYGEDVELSYRLRRAGYLLRYCPTAVVFHYSYESESQFKPLQYTGSTFANMYIRLKYGNWKDILAVPFLGSRLLIEAEVFSGSRRLVLKNIVKLLLVAPKALLSRRRSPAYFPFRDWDYDMIRDGAFIRVEALSSDQPRVTVITRTYRGRSLYLRQAMLSVAHQTYPNIEHIIVEDGGCTQRTVVEEISAVTHHPVIFYGLDKVGRSATGNAGLSAATGRWCLFLDDDDLLFADHVEVLVNALLNNPQAVAAYTPSWQVITDTARFNDGEYLEVTHGVPAALRQPFDYEVLRHHNFMAIQSVLFERRLFLEQGGFEVDMDALEDWVLWNRYAQCGKFVYVEKLTSLFRTPFDKNNIRKRQAELDKAYPLALCRIPHGL